MFDDLADPLGPPTGDALGSVLARARRRRVTRVGSTALIAVVAVAAIAVAANALGSSSKTVHVAGTTTTSPTTTTAPSSATSATSTSTTTQPVASPELWSGLQLTITPKSLGQVTVGMTLDQAQAAAGVAIDGAADSAFFPTTLPADFPHLFFNEDPSNTVSCVGAEIADYATNPQTVVTPEGFRLGDTVQQLLTIYGSRARYSPAPPTGISTRAGYVVTEPDGNLAFYIDETTGRIYGIKGGGADLTPSSCNG